jgi:hypothetical protein
MRNSVGKEVAMRNIGGRGSSATRLVVTAILAVGALLVSAVGASAQGADPLAVVQRFYDLRNAGNVAGSMALVADDVRLVGGPACTVAKPCIGRDAVQRDMVQNFLPLHAHLTIVGAPQVSGDQVKARAAVTSDRTRAAGVDRQVVNLTVVVRDGKIESGLSQPDPSDPQTAKFLAFEQAQAAAAVTNMPATGGGGTVTLPSLAWLAGALLLALGLAIRWATRAR